MAKDVGVIVNEVQAMSLHLDIAKGELIHKSFGSVSDSLLASFKKNDLMNMSLLGSPHTPGPELDRKLKECCADLSTAIRHLELI